MGPFRRSPQIRHGSCHRAHRTLGRIQTRPDGPDPEGPEAWAQDRPPPCPPGRGAPAQDQRTVEEGFGGRTVKGESTSRTIHWGKLLGLIIVLTLGIGTIVVFKGILLPLAFAFLFSYILSPIVDRMEGMGMSRTVAILLLYLAMLGVLGVGIAVLVPVVRDQVQKIAQDFPIYQVRFRGMMIDLAESIDRYVPGLSGDRFVDIVSGWFQRTVETLMQRALKWVQGLISTFTLAIIVPFAAFFFLRDGHRFKTLFVQWVPNRYFEMTLNLLWRIDRQIGGYIRGQVLEALAVGVLAAVGFALIHLPYFLLVGAIAGVTNVIPYFGPFIGFLTATLVALLTGGSGMLVLEAAAVALIVQQIDNLLVQPMVMARSVALHPLVVMFAVLAGGSLMGIVGMVLAVPVVGVLKVTAQTVLEGIRAYMAAQEVQR
ncbi:MAG TPA: AI-2E family transporter [Candidatus Latescibacteria bacterium]|nr:AI-2E family transporter [Candidatus Latescibacterota bacterium]